MIIKQSSSRTLGDLATSNLAVNLRAVCKNLVRLTIVLEWTRGFTDARQAPGQKAAGAIKKIKKIKRERDIVVHEHQ